MTTLWEIIQHLSKLAPTTYVPLNDTNGIIVGIGDEAKQKRVRISSAAIALDVTVPVVIKSGDIGATLLIAHRSPFSQGSVRFTGLAHMIFQQLLKRNLTVYVAHYSWAMVDGGINDVLAHTLGFEVINVFNTTIGGSTYPLGRICQVPKETTLKAFIQHVTKRLDIPFLRYVGKLEEEVERLVIVSGQGITREWLHLAWEQGYDTYLTGHLTHEIASHANQLKIKVVAVPQMATEIPGMSRLTQILRAEHHQVDFTFIEPLLPYSNFPR